ncbi:MAG: hypothetical protein ACTSQZ_08990 [Candidatus Thorarchaeota archaeon]
MGINNPEPVDGTFRICQLAKPMPIGSESRLKEFDVFRVGIILLVASWFLLILVPVALLLLAYSQKENIGKFPFNVKTRKTTVVFVIVLLGIFAWSPWITEEYALDTVVSHAGGPDEQYNYLGDIMPVSDIPKTFVRVPFGALVYFPGEAMYIVTFWGWVL